MIARDGGTAGSSAPPGMPPRPTGDADGMEALAAELSGCAGVLESIPPIRLTNWESGAARRAKAAIEAAVGVGRKGAPRAAGAGRRAAPGGDPGPGRAGPLGPAGGGPGGGGTP